MRRLYFCICPKQKCIDLSQFLICKVYAACVFSKRERITLRLLYAIADPSVCRLSVCRLSVTLVHVVGNRVVDLLLVLIELSSLAITVEAL